VDEKFYLLDGSSGGAAFTVVVTPERAGWAHCGLRVLKLEPGATHTSATDDDEVLSLPLSGSCRVTRDGETFALQGRRDVFSLVSDFANAPRGAAVTATSAGGGVFALPSARGLRGGQARPATLLLKEPADYAHRPALDRRIVPSRASPVRHGLRSRDRHRPARPTPPPPSRQQQHGQG